MNQWGPVAVIVGGYVIGLYFQSRQIESLRHEINAKFDSVNVRFDAVNERIDSLRSEMNAKFDAAKEALLRVEGVLDARIKHLWEKEK